MSAHNLLILIHASAGGVAFISGCIVLVPSMRASARSIWLTVFLVGLTVLICALLAVVALDWPHFILAKKITFSILGLLALYMGWRASQAYRVFRNNPTGWFPSFTDHVGFDLISLFDGLCIVSALDLGAPIWFVGIIAILGVAVGIWAIHQVKTAEMKQTIRT
jgi:hypothetical protein